MKVKLQYGSGRIEVDVPSSDMDILEPQYVAGLSDEEASFGHSVNQPIAARPMKELIRGTDRLALVILVIYRKMVL